SGMCMRTVHNATDKKLLADEYIVDVHGFAGDMLCSRFVRSRFHFVSLQNFNNKFLAARERNSAPARASEIGEKSASINGIAFSTFERVHNFPCKNFSAAYARFVCSAIP